MLDTQWQVDLPNTGTAITSTLINHTGSYAASNGFVFRLDRSEGNLVATNELSGTGNHEVRLAAPLDESLLVASTHGYVIGMDPTSLHTRWSVDLPGSGYEVVSVLCAKGGVYVGSNGFVYLLDPGNGHVKATKELSGYGDHEVRLGITLDLSVLLVGINGSALGLNPTSLAISWKTSFPASSSNITSVAGGVNCGYAGCNGRLYRLDESTGKVLNENHLGGTGDNEVQMVLDAEGVHLYAGTNGYGIGLHPDTLKTVYSVDLPGSGHSVTGVADGDQVGYFANNGYVFQLDSTGSVTGKNPLPGLGKDETRLATDLNGTGELAVGIRGFSAALDLSAAPTQYAAWMGQLAPQIGPKLLRQVALPGTHDSGAYGFWNESKLGQDTPDWAAYIDSLHLLPAVVKPIIINWSMAQSTDFSHQLALGIRYLDLRVQGAGSFNFVHGLVASPVTDLFNQINNFLAQPGSDKEVILLDFNHFYGMTPALHAQLAAMILKAFGNKLAPASLGAGVTLNQLWATTYRIIVLYLDQGTVNANPFLWSQSTIASPWPNKQDPKSLHDALAKELPNTRSTFFVLQGVLTPDKKTIENGLRPFSKSPGSLLAQAKVLNPQLHSWLTKEWRSMGINIVICDWFNYTSDYVDGIIQLNK